jgi:hypothetical protein
LEDLLNNPFVGVDKRAKRLGLVPRDSTIIQNRLIENKIIRSAVIDRRKLFELTEQGEKIIAELGLKIKKDKNQSIEHRYFTEKVKELLEKDGWTVFKEKSDLDLVAQMDDKTVAIEVETGKNNIDQIEKNIAKLVQFAAADRFILATNESATIKIQNLISQIDLSESLHLYPIKEFIKNPPIKFTLTPK